jgi:hypothetical protein
MCLRKYIAKIDFISPEPSERIHFGNSAIQRTVIGCICSIFIVSSFLIIASVQGYSILKGKNPIIEIMYSPWEYKNGNEIEKMHYKHGFPLYF